MKRILISLISSLLLSCPLMAMQQKQQGPEPIVYPLRLFATLAVGKTLLFRLDTEYALIDDTLKAKTWGSPLKKISCSIDAEVARAHTTYEIVNAALVPKNHSVSVQFTVKDGDSGVYTGEELFVIPINLGQQIDQKVATPSGVLDLTVGVKMFDDPRDDGSDF